MAIGTHGSRFTPYGGGRVIGGVDEPEVVDGPLPPLRPATGLTVGVIDTGVVLDGLGRPHPWFGRDHLSYCAEEDEDVLAQVAGQRASSDGHGTFVAGLVLREAPSARVRMWGVLDKERVAALPTGRELTDRDDTAVAAALAALAINPRVQVINLSFGGGVWAEDHVPGRLDAALRQLLAHRPDVAVVAAAGNESTQRKVWPAAFDQVVSVGALDEHDPAPSGAAPSIAPFSNTGGWVRAYASGVKVLGPYTASGGAPGWARWSGTSFAAAVVSGRIAQVAIERGISGAQAAAAVQAESVPVPGRTAVWVRSVDSAPLPRNG